MKLATCPHCGQIIPPKVTFQGPITRAIYDYVTNRPYGVTTEQIVRFVYAHDPNGGPEDSSTVRVLIYRMNKVLKNHGVKISCPKGQGGVYAMRPLPQQANDVRRI